MLFMDPQKSWLLIGRAKLISTNGPSFTFCTQPLYVILNIESHYSGFCHCAPLETVVALKN